jgi:hypothetical protein
VIEVIDKKCRRFNRSGSCPLDVGESFFNRPQAIKSNAWFIATANVISPSLDRTVKNHVPTDADTKPRSECREVADAAIPSVAP